MTAAVVVVVAADVIAVEAAVAAVVAASLDTMCNCAFIYGHFLIHVQLTKMSRVKT